MKIWNTALAAYLLVVGQTTVPQSGSASLEGTVSGFDGSVVGDAPVRARNPAAGIDARTRSSPTGRYEFRDLPEGTYVVSVNMPCCVFDPYVNPDVTVGEGQTRELDIELSQGLSLNIEGDDPTQVNSALLERQIVPDLPTPRSADGRPDLSGVWLISRDPFPEAPEPLPWAAELAEQRLADRLVDLPASKCLPSEPIRPSGAALIAKFVQTPDIIVILFESVPGFRQIFMDGRGHPTLSNPTWMGHSIGQWEGDTLVIETVGFNDRGWSGVFPRTEEMRMEERYRRTDYGHLEVQVTIDDPGVFAAPWIRNMTWDLAPQAELMEYVCENNQWGQ